MIFIAYKLSDAIEFGIFIAEKGILRPKKLKTKRIIYKQQTKWK